MEEQSSGIQQKATEGLQGGEGTEEERRKGTGGALGQREGRKQRERKNEYE